MEMLQSAPIAALFRLDGKGPLAQVHLESIESLKLHESRGVSQRAEMVIARIQRESRYMVRENREFLGSSAIHDLELGLYQVELQGDLIPEFVPDEQALVDHSHQGIQRRALEALVIHALQQLYGPQDESK